jgi:hypothetical protein
MLSLKDYSSGEDEMFSHPVGSTLADGVYSSTASV